MEKGAQNAVPPNLDITTINTKQSSSTSNIFSKLAANCNCEQTVEKVVETTTCSCSKAITKAVDSPDPNINIHDSPQLLNLDVSDRPEEMVNPEMPEPDFPPPPLDNSQDDVPEMKTDEALQDLQEQNDQEKNVREQKPEVQRRNTTPCGREREREGLALHSSRRYSAQRPIKCPCTSRDFQGIVTCSCKSSAPIPETELEANETNANFAPCGRSTLVSQRLSRSYSRNPAQKPCPCKRTIVDSKFLTFKDTTMCKCKQAFVAPNPEPLPPPQSTEIPTVSELCPYCVKPTLPPEGICGGPQPLSNTPSDENLPPKEIAMSGDIEDDPSSHIFVHSATGGADEDPDNDGTTEAKANLGQVTSACECRSGIRAQDGLTQQISPNQIVPRPCICGQSRHMAESRAQNRIPPPIVPRSCRCPLRCDMIESTQRCVCGRVRNEISQSECSLPAPQPLLVQSSSDKSLTGRNQYLQRQVCNCSESPPQPDLSHLQHCPWARPTSPIAGEQTHQEIISGFPSEQTICPCRQRENATRQNATELQPRNLANIPLILMNSELSASDKKTYCTCGKEMDTSFSFTPATVATETSFIIETTCNAVCLCRNDIITDEEYYSLSSTEKENESSIGRIFLNTSSDFQSPEPHIPREVKQEIPCLCEDQGIKKSMIRHKKSPRSDRTPRNLVILKLLNEVVQLINEDSSLTDSSVSLAKQKIRNIVDCSDVVGDAGAFSSRTNLSGFKITFLEKSAEPSQGECLRDPQICTSSKVGQPSNFVSVGIEAQSFMNWNTVSEQETFAMDRLQNEGVSPCKCDCDTEISAGYSEFVGNMHAEASSPISKPSQIQFLDYSTASDKLENVTPTSIKMNADMDPSCGCDESYFEEIEYENVSECEKDNTTKKSGKGHSPKIGCDCCHCQAMRDLGTCNTIATSEQAMVKDDCIREMKYFIDNMIMDLNAMAYARGNRNNKSSPPQPSAICERRSFPVSIIDVTELGRCSLYVKWCIHDCYGIGGYEIYVDGHLTNRYFSARHEAGVICNVDVRETHKVVLLALPIRDDPEDDYGCLNKAKKSEKNKCLARQSTGGHTAIWTPSIYFYDPVCKQAVPSNPLRLYD